jgi:hypothetical protein
VEALWASQQGPLHTESHLEVPSQRWYVFMLKQKLDSSHFNLDSIKNKTKQQPLLNFYLDLLWVSDSFVL